MSTYYALPAEQALAALTSGREGLAPTEAQRRLAQYGPNELREERRASWLSILARQFTSFLILILVVAAVISFLLGETLDAVAIVVIVVLNGILGFVQEYRAERTLEALREMAAPHARVHRADSDKVVPALEVVPGDIVLLEAGDQVPADGRLIEVINLQIDESPLTGESVPSAKFVESLPKETTLGDRENMAYAGTSVTYGRGTAVVTATGMETEFGKIAARIQQTTDEQTPLQKRLQSLGVIMGVLVLAVSAILFALEVLQGEPLLESFILAVALAVSAVPEGLPAVVTVTLAMGVRRMSRRNAIIRRLASVETLGATTVICTDKTGTLTRDEMTVTRVWAGGRVYGVTGAGYAPGGEITENGSAADLAERSDLGLLLRVGSLNSHAALSNDGAWAVIGDPTEGALLTLAAKAGLRRSQLLEEYPLVDEIPFDSTRKRMTTIHQVDGRRVAYVKGAPEMIIAQASRVQRDGQIEPLEQDERARLITAVQEMASQGLRVLAFAHREVSESVQPKAEEVERELVIVGLVGMMDPPRAEVAQAIETTRRAGIRPVMITGDHELTGQAIAKRIGLLRDGAHVITGAELERMDDEALWNGIGDIDVVARSSPTHKVRILEALQHNGHVVAMTGDGVNDAPAVKQADVGVAMGISGTEVTKQAADMVLADDNFATIVAAVQEGRGTYDNIRKFIRLLLSTNLDELLLIATATLMGLPLPLLPIQVLWINIVSDGLPALALSFDPYDPHIMERRPRNPKEGVFHGMLLFIIVAGLVAYLASTALLLVWQRTEFIDLARLRTILFSSTIVFELLFVFNVRSETHSVFRMNPFSNPLLVGASVLSLLLQIAVVYVPFLQRIFQTVPLTGQDWLIVLAIGATGLLVLPEVFMRTSGRAQRTSP